MDVGVKIVEPAVAIVVAHRDAHAVAAIRRADALAHFHEIPGQRIGAAVVAEELGADRSKRAIERDDIKSAGGWELRNASDLPSAGRRSAITRSAELLLAQFCKEFLRR